MIIGAFPSQTINPSHGDRKARDFVSLYAKAGKTKCTFSKQTQLERWRKLIYNATFNPICAVLDADTGDLRNWQVIDDLVRPAMQEVVAVAKAKSFTFDEDIVEQTIAMDEACGASRPSMSVDVSKVSLIYLSSSCGRHS